MFTKKTAFQKVVMSLTLVLGMVLLLSACNKKEDNIRELETLSADMSLHSSSYSEDEWTDALLKYQNLTDKLKKVELTPEEQQRLDKVKGEIFGYIAKHAAGETGSNASGNGATSSAKEEGTPKESAPLTITVNGVSFEMIRVEAGTFTMGATSEQDSARNDEYPTHRVTLTKNYYLGKTEVTQALWKAVMGSNPSYYKGNNKPVESVSWDDCQTFIKKLNAATGKNFRLPTEAEWEFAARGGNKSGHYQYSGSNNLSEVAWYDGRNGTHNVALKHPNELGLYDMSGNVWEWCQDWYGDYSSGSQTNPTGPNSGANRVVRGGSWHIYAGDCRSSRRYLNGPDDCSSYLGLRLALSE